jgi:hypothetical protein
MEWTQRWLRLCRQMLVRTSSYGHIWSLMKTAYFATSHLQARRPSRCFAFLKIYSSASLLLPTPKAAMPQEHPRPFACESQFSFRI